jgi:fatty-acyl-CoA synthase
MNDNHKCCAGPEWAEYLHTEVLPTVTRHVDLGRELIEVGPGPGAATDWLHDRVQRLIAVELEPEAAALLAARFAETNVEVTNDDATALAFAHTLGALMADSHGISRTDTLLAATPMFHVAAWGAPYSCAYAPATLVLPGKDTSAEALAGLIESERVTLGFGVPTIWIQLERAFDDPDRDLSSFRTIQCGGAASPRALIDRYARRGVAFVQSWGMTEMSPIGTSMRVTGTPQGPDGDSTVAKVGVPSPGVELRLVDADGAVLPWDGAAVGELESRGPWVIRAYLDPDDDANETRFDDGWLRTGDLARIEPDGTVEIVDRLKDLIKSGGEWISSLDLERAISAHPDVSEVAVAAVSDPRWGERPAAMVVLTPDSNTTRPGSANTTSGPSAPSWRPRQPEKRQGAHDKLEDR